jgi:hypothetical protein
LVVVALEEEEDCFFPTSRISSRVDPIFIPLLLFLNSSLVVIVVVRSGDFPPPQPAPPPPPPWTPCF